MNFPHCLLAELEEGDQLILKSLGRSGLSQTTIVFGSLAAIAVLVFAFVFIFRKQLFRKRKHHHHHRRAPVAETLAVTVKSRDSDGGRRKRRLRRGHRPINPTLAQTHGLPPIRDPGTPPPGL